MPPHLIPQSQSRQQPVRQRRFDYEPWLATALLVAGCVFLLSACPLVVSGLRAKEQDRDPLVSLARRSSDPGRPSDYRPATFMEKVQTRALLASFLVMMLSASAMAFRFFWSWRPRGLQRRWRRLRYNRCRGCGYSLTGNVSGVCPECGRPVSSLPRMQEHKASMKTPPPN